MTLPQPFLDRMQKTLGSEFEAFLSSYDLPPRKGIRVNTLKITPKEFEKITPFALRPIPWEENGFFVSEEKLGGYIEHFAGLYYVQEPSAMCAAPLLDVKPYERVLDLCSAPGGKGTRLAQATEGKGIVILNEINFSRAKILSSNVERMGIRNAIVTCADPKSLAQKFAGYFDKILVDAPCSGEGMFKKEENAIPEWSEQNVALCAARQKEILQCAHVMLKGGGKLVYSTCTFAEEEDEEQIKNFLQCHPEYRLLSEEKLYPHKVEGEGHYAALLFKKEGEGNDLPLQKTGIDKKLLTIYRAFEKETMQTHFDNLYLVGNNLYSLPDDCPALTVQTLRAGVQLGEFVGGRFEPAHALAMAANKSELNGFEVDEKTAESYLQGNTFACDERLKGWQQVRYNGFGLGWCKCVNGIAKNHYPKGLRKVK
jgi:NOL1/NOP2/sun family putative RNA methylase